MAKKQTAFVVVQKSWFNLAMNALVTRRDSQSEVDAHVLIADLDDVTDHRGLWIRNIKSAYQNKKDDSWVMMKLMIPWQFVLSVGLVDKSVSIRVGFNNTTVLTADSRAGSAA